MNRPSIDEDKEETIGDALSRAAEAVPEYLYDLNQLEVHILSPTDPEETAEIIDLTTEAAGEYQAGTCKRIGSARSQSMAHILSCSS